MALRGLFVPAVLVPLTGFRTLLIMMTSMGDKECNGQVFFYRILVMLFSGVSSGKIMGAVYGYPGISLKFGIDQWRTAVSPPPSFIPSTIIILCSPFLQVATYIYLQEKGGGLCPSR